MWWVKDFANPFCNKTQATITVLVKALSPLHVCRCESFLFLGKYCDILIGSDLKN